MFGYTERLGARAQDSGRRRPQMVYWPAARPFLLAGLVAVALVIGLLQVGIFSYVFDRLGISSGVADAAAGEPDRQRGEPARGPVPQPDR
jgi:hypothetical protein